MAINLIIHIPHASTYIPPDVRKDILLEDKVLDREILLMTDLNTDEVPVSSGQASVIKAPISRLVVDVERFRDDKNEEMAKVGMGAVYTNTHDGRPLRRLAPGQREELLKRYYDPHHEKLTKTVGDALRNCGNCLIVDVHSFSSIPLPHEPDQSSSRPDICLGTDAFHTPDSLYKHAKLFFEKQRFVVKRNIPFKGTMVPCAFYKKNPLVHSIMVEINRKWVVDTRERSRNIAAAIPILELLSDWIQSLFIDNCS